MLNTVINMFKVPELRKRLGFTLLMILIYRVGTHIPTPGIDVDNLKDVFESLNRNSGGGILGMYDMFVGGAFKKATIFALGIMPYISASIIIQLFGTVFPYFHKLQREGAEGKKKITQITRYFTLVIALAQSVGIAAFLMNFEYEGNKLVLESIAGWQFYVLSVVGLTTGTLFTMWLGEQITNRGIGNGISLLILVGIIARMPDAIIGILKDVFVAETQHPFQAMFVGLVVLAITAFIVFMYQATRRIPIQTPKKSVGGKTTSGQNTVLPLRLNMAGVIPIIFASSLMMVPGLVGKGLEKAGAGFGETLQLWFIPGNAVYQIVFALVIIFFTYFYTAIIFNPVDIAENLKRNGGFIPGIRPGKETSDYLEKVLSRITLPGSFFLALIAIAPFWLKSGLNVSFYLGGTSILIVVGVAIDSLQQIESKLQSRNYRGFMKKGSLKGRIG